MTTLSPSPPISLSPPSAGERLVRSIAPPALKSNRLCNVLADGLKVRLVGSPPFCTFITLTTIIWVSNLNPYTQDSIPHQSLIDVVTGALPSLPLRTTTTMLYIYHQLCDHRYDISESRAASLSAELHEHDKHDLYALQRMLRNSRQYDWWRKRAYASERLGVQAIRLICDLIRSIKPIMPQADLAALPETRPVRFVSTARQQGELDTMDHRLVIPDSPGWLLESDSHSNPGIYIRTLGPEAYTMTWEVLKKNMTDKYYPQGEMKKLEIELWNLKVKGNDVPA
ncbi:hypothetical protein Tco_0194872 [Tanacetum coccineum]